ncbi:MAG: FtsW/RodA/SpoVE family cell cycle protein [Phycisphaerales bacterium]
MDIRPGQVVGLCAFALLCTGVLMVNSADMMVSRVQDASDVVASMTLGSVLTSRAAMYMGLALLALFAGSLLVPVRTLSAVARSGTFRGMGVLPLLLIGAAAIIAFCALAYMPGIGDPRNGSHRWIKLGSKELSMQPSEVAKWLFIPLLAWYCTVRASRLGAFFTGLVPAMIAVGGVAGFVLIEDLGTGVLIGAAACVVLVSAGAKWWHFALPGAVAAGGVVAAIMTNDYRQNRVKAFLNPYQDPEGIGFHMIQSLVAIYNGKGVGTGLGEGIQKRGYLPEDRTDYIFAVICEETGIAGAGLVLALFLGLLWAGMSIARSERDPFLRLWSLGIIATIGMQAVMNLLVVTGLAPAKGIALPFVSYGGTGWILTAFSIGVLVAIDRTRAATETSADESPTPLVAA